MNEDTVTSPWSCKTERQSLQHISRTNLPSIPQTTNRKNKERERSRIPIRLSKQQIHRTSSKVKLLGDYIRQIRGVGEEVWIHQLYFYFISFFIFFFTRGINGGTLNWAPGDISGKALYLGAFEVYRIRSAGLRMRIFGGGQTIYGCGIRTIFRGFIYLFFPPLFSFYLGYITDTTTTCMGTWDQKKYRWVDG